MRPRVTRRAITLIEILVVLTLVGVMAAMSGGVFSSVLDYFRGRKSSENLLWDVRRLQQNARSRGNTTTVFGVRFFTGRMLGGEVEASGFSYLPYGPVTAAPSAATLGALSASEQANVVNFDPAVRMVVDGTVPVPATLPLPLRIQFQRDPLSGDFRPDAVSPVRLDMFVTNVGTFSLTIEGGSFAAVRFLQL